ncbi:hypothetical protein EYF80_068003 [Liparis tanakae]|uniref:Uncharacterized protein n=1 Tax=Liparis tanakae TaxID=230148 RepID=A0A4Z2DZD1_9TELE|nr:hypothetical protein EYF80_068003 [Liparis tanakae]
MAQGRRPACRCLSEECVLSRGKEGDSEAAGGRKVTLGLRRADGQPRSRSGSPRLRLAQRSGNKESAATGPAKVGGTAKWVVAVVDPRVQPRPSTPCF